MLIVRDTKHVERLGAPPWMADAADLQSREDADGRLWAIGDPRLVGPVKSSTWSDIGDGYQVRIIEPFVPALLMRKPFWCPFEIVEDQRGRQWMAPRILAKAGAILAIQVTYGPDWKPDLSLEQATAERVARWALQTADKPVDVTIACTAAADLMAAVMHITSEIVAKLRLLDQGLMLSFLRTAKGSDQ